jgi:hypothetical protein
MPLHWVLLWWVSVLRLYDNGHGLLAEPTLAISNAWQVSVPVVMARHRFYSFVPTHCVGTRLWMLHVYTMNNTYA